MSQRLSGNVYTAVFSRDVALVARWAHRDSHHPIQGFIKLQPDLQSLSLQVRSILLVLVVRGFDAMDESPHLSPAVDATDCHLLVAASFGFLYVTDTQERTADRFACVGPCVSCEPEV